MNQLLQRAPLGRALAAWLADETDIATERGEAPRGAGWQGAPGTSVFVPYLVLHGIPGGTVDGPLGDPHADAGTVWQVNAHGRDPDQAERAADRARTALLAAVPDLDLGTYRVTSIDIDVLGGDTRQDQDQPAVWWTFDRFLVDATPLTVP